MSEIMANTKSRKTKFSDVWNLPNVLTYGRIVAVPLVAGLLMWGGQTARWVALAIFVCSRPSPTFSMAIWRGNGSSNRLAGRDARSHCRQGAGGRGAAGACGGWHVCPAGHIWAAIIILAREVLVSGLREFLGELQVSVPVTQIAKWKTTVQLVAIGFLIAGPAGDLIVPGITWIGIAGLWIAAGSRSIRAMIISAPAFGMSWMRNEDLYFARLRQIIGRGQDDISVPAEVKTVSGLD